jgi:HlyD family secretion protein
VALGLVVLVTGLGAGYRHLSASLGRRRPTGWELLPTATVRRGDLFVSVTASGRIESSEQTSIDCELESLEAGVRGQRLYAGGASTLIYLIPDGSMVKKGDVLCKLDSSEYEELVRQQEMTVERAKADHLQTELDLAVARMAVQEFRDGLKLSTLKELDGRIALAKSELERASDHRSWTERMLIKGYVSRSQASADAVSERRAAFNLEQAQLSADVFKRYEVPGTMRILENAVLSCEASMRYQDARLERHTNRLKSFKRQVENCTIRAPHDGFLIHANDPRRHRYIEEGMAVYQHQTLFYLPDLAKMEVSAMLHESVVDKVKEGMRAKIQIESLPHHTLEGHVTSVARLPLVNFFSEVTYYVGLIKIDNIPRGLLPGMSAEVKIATDRRSDVLTVPPAAVTVEGGREVCYVAEEDGLERREVKLGQLTEDRLEVTEGLEEGEHVVLEPASVNAPDLVANTTSPAESAPLEAADTAAENVDTH